MDADQLLASLGLTMNLPDLRFDEHGCARLLFDQKLAVDLENDADNDCIHVYSVLGSAPHAGSGEATLRKLLEGNLFGAQTQGAALAIDAPNNEIVLCRSFDIASASTQAFESFMEKFLTAVEHWLEDLATVADGRADGMRAEPVSSAPLMSMFSRA